MPLRRWSPRGPFVAALRLALALLVLGACTAEAYRGERRTRPPARVLDPHPPRAAEDPLQIVVSVGTQRLFVYDRIGLLESSTVSTGVGGYPTPTGIFSVLDKEWQHYSNIYGAAPMPFMQRLTMSGVALHSGQVTGRPASHGCIRLPHAFAIRLYKLTKLGARVVIANNEPVPAEIAHPRLFVRQPTPSPAVVPGESLAVALATAAQFDEGVADARLGKITAERWRTLDALPISIFVSGKEGKLFVRHGFRPLFDAPVTIRAQERRLGTHLFTALDYKDATHTDMRWQVLSMPETAGGERVSLRVAARAGEEVLAAVGPSSDAAEALDRLALPPDAARRIAELIAPGASLIVSDHGWNREMRNQGTDFIVLTH